MAHAHPTRPATRLVTGACALVTVAGLAACTSSAGGTRSDDGSDSAGSTSTVSPPPTFSGVQHPLPSGSALKNVPNLYQEVRLTSCTATPAGWKGIGTAHNTTAGTRDYRIVVLFTDAQARAVDSATTTVTVPAGATRDWTASRKFTAPKGTQCVVRAVRAA